MVRVCMGGPAAGIRIFRAIRFLQVRPIRCASPAMRSGPQPLLQTNRRWPALYRMPLSPRHSAGNRGAALTRVFASLHLAVLASAQNLFDCQSNCSSCHMPKRTDDDGMPRLRTTDPRQFPIDGSTMRWHMRSGTMRVRLCLPHGKFSCGEAPSHAYAEARASSKSTSCAANSGPKPTTTFPGH